MYSLTIYFVDLDLNEVQKKIVDEFIDESRKKYNSVFHIYSIFQKDFVTNSVKSDISLIVSEKEIVLPYKDNQYLLRFFTLSGLENDLNELFLKFEIEIQELEVPYTPPHHEFNEHQLPTNHDNGTQTNHDLKDAVEFIFDQYINGVSKDELEDMAQKYHSYKFIEIIEQLYKSRVNKETLDNILEHIDQIDIDELIAIFEAKQKLKNYGNISVGGDESMSIGNKIKPIDQSAKREVGKIATVSSHVASVDPFKGIFK
ncbi:MAG: hypothetical protein M0P43_07525 [Arcobacteraceae bacterium]|nr:hypothetical protein [Arcobacteraceae bacterium]